MFKAKYRQPLLAIHLAVLLFALSGLFAKWLIIPAVAIVFGRSLFASIALGIVFLVTKKPFFQSSKELLFLAITGVILAIHWVTFFAAIQFSSVTVGLITFATFPLFVSFLEPLVFKEDFHIKSLVQALLTIVGIALVLPMQAIGSGMGVGAILGVVSALTFAILTLLNRKFVIKTPAITVAFYQNVFASICLLPYFFVFPIIVSFSEVIILIVLGVIFTALAHTLFNYSLKQLKAQTVSIAVSLEPIYGIVAAVILLDESLTLTMQLGCAIVVITNIWALRNSSGNPNSETLI